MALTQALDCYSCVYSKVSGTVTPGSTVNCTDPFDSTKVNGDAWLTTSTCNGHCSVSYCYSTKYMGIKKKNSSVLIICHVNS